MGEKDIGGKYLIERDPAGWIRWLLDDPTIEALEVVSPEFQFVGRRGDSLIRARGKAGEFGVLAELQLAYDTDMPSRLQNYAALGRQKLGLPIVPIVIYLTPPPGEVEPPAAYHAEFMGLVTHQDFKVVKLWEIKASAALEMNLPASVLPYIPLMDGADEAIIRACVGRIRAEPDHEELETILAMFAMIRMSAETVEQLLRWDMTVLEKSPLYRQILEQGIQQGLEQARLGTRSGTRLRARVGRKRDTDSGAAVRPGAIGFTGSVGGTAPGRTETIVGRSVKRRRLP
jgi:predicted transposase YdaD